MLANRLINDVLVNAARRCLPSRFLGFASPFGFATLGQALIQEFAVGLRELLNQFQDLFHGRL